MSIPILSYQPLSRRCSGPPKLNLHIFVPFSLITYVSASLFVSSLPSPIRCPYWMVINLMEHAPEIVVPLEGFEPTRPFGHQILSLARLTKFRHKGIFEPSVGVEPTLPVLQTGATPHSLPGMCKNGIRSKLMYSGRRNLGFTRIA